MIKRINEKAIILWIIGIYITPYFIREQIFYGGIYPINILSWLGIVVFLINNYINNGKIYFRTKKFNVFLWIMLFNLLMISFFYANVDIFDMKNNFKIVIAIFLPILLINLEFKNIYEIKIIYNRVLKIVNISTYFILFCGIWDYCFNFKMSTFFVNLYNIPSLYEMLNMGRLVSYFGHSLLTTEMVLIYYILNYIDQYYISKTQKIYMQFIISLIILTFTGSKTGIVLIIIMYTVQNFNIKKFKYIPIVFITCFGIYKLGFFDTIINRFLMGINTGDLTTGRHTSLIELYNSNLLEFNLLKGHSSLSMQSDAFIAALEYPVLRWAYRYGIVFSIIMSILLFLIPIIKIYKHKDIKFLFLTIIFMIDINSYSSITTTMDGMMIYCTVLFIIFNVLRYIKEEES